MLELKMETPPAQAPCALRRLRSELQECQRNPLPYYSADIVDGNFFHWQASIIGPHGSCFEGGKFFLDFQFPSNYPFGIPKIKFITPIFHPNINSDGDINIFCERYYAASLTVPKVLLSIYSIIDDPLINEPLVPEIANMYLTDRVKYNNTAKEWCQRYAMAMVPPSQSALAAPTNANFKQNSESAKVTKPALLLHLEPYRSNPVFAAGMLLQLIKDNKVDGEMLKDPDFAVYKVVFQSGGYNIF
uniref:UBC core domain-containing protein n=1 Tax=Panagrolaimus sp. ES5 TaxID=591445 RepID=A0AC34G7B3_9BILA